MRYGLTERQTKCLAFIRTQLESTGVPPSYDEIRIALGLKSKSPVHKLVHQLVERGHLITSPKKVRVLALAPNGA